MYKYYLASRYSRHEEILEYANELRAAGLEVTSRWIQGYHSADHLTGEAHKKASLSFATEDYEDVLAADAIILFPDPPRTTTRGGKNVEFGIALGTGKPVFIVGEEWENIFHHLPQVTRFNTWNEFKEARGVIY